MMHLKQSLKRPLQAIPTRLAVFLLVVALIGFADASYLTVEHYRGVIPPCSVVSGCETVLTSTYAVIAGVPVALLGVIFYFVVLVGVFSFLESKKTILLKWALLFTVTGFLFSLWFVYAQAFIIGAWCQYCLLSVFTSAILFVTSYVVLNKYRLSDQLQNDQEQITQ